MKTLKVKTLKRKLSPTNSGKRAESAVESHLKSLGHDIIAKNYRTRFYEIDIISTLATTYGNKIFFTEVKYRRSAERGDGFDYITPKKLIKMQSAAEDFLNYRHLHLPASLAAASVSGENYRVDDWFEIEE